VLLRGGRRGAEPWVGVDWAPGEDEGDTMASSADCMLVSWVKVDRKWLGGKDKMSRGSSQAKRLCLSIVVRIVVRRSVSKQCGVCEGT
jgi:hypothetical protein